MSRGKRLGGKNAITDSPDARDCSGHREIPGLRMTRRAKDEALREIAVETGAIEALRGEGDGFTEPLSVEERLLIAHFVGLLRGRREGREMAEFEADFRLRHRLAPEAPLPHPREMLRMEDRLAKTEEVTPPRAPRVHHRRHARRE